MIFVVVNAKFTGSPTSIVIVKYSKYPIDCTCVIAVQMVNPDACI